jgi:hypothetical protein
MKNWQGRYQSFGLYRDRLYFPAYGMTPMGVLREIEPVQILPVTEKRTLSLAVTSAQIASACLEISEKYPIWRVGIARGGKA